MKEYIEREAAIDYIKNYQCRGCSDIGLCGKCAVLIALKLLEKVPSVQPERKKGKWYKPKEFPRDSYRFVCNNCQEVAYYVTGNNGKKNKEDNPKCGYRFCPNCGAKMEVDDEGRAD